MANGNSDLIKTLRSKTTADVNAGKRRQYTVNLDFTDIQPNYLGSIVLHKASQFEEMEIGVKTSGLLGGNTSVDITTGNLALMIATLDTITDSKPDWFDVFDPDFEYEILEAVYLEYIEWRNTFRKNRGGDNATSNSGPTDGAAKVVDTEGVQSTTN